MSAVPSATSHFTSDANRHVVVLTISRAACRGGFRWFFPWSRCFSVYLRVTCMLRQERNPQANQYGGGPVCGEDTRAAGPHDPCGGILDMRKQFSQRTQVFDGTIFSYRRLRDYDAEVRKPVGLSAALIILVCSPFGFLVRQLLSFQGEGWLTHDGSQFPFVTFRRHFKSGDRVIFRNFKWSSRFDDLAECVGVQLKDS